MHYRTCCSAAYLLVYVATAAWAQPAPPPGGTPPGGTPPGGTPPGGSSAASVTYYATYKLDGGTATGSGQTYQASATDTSAVWVDNGGSLLLNNSTLRTTGNTSSDDSSSFYGLNAGLLLTAGSSATVTGGSITTSGRGANGGFATGTASTLTLEGTRIDATGDGGHGVMATLGGTIVLRNVAMTTAGANSGAIATDRGGGTITSTGGTVVTSGRDSPGIYSTGNITVSSAVVKATGAEAAVIEGANTITLVDTDLSSTLEKWGVMIYQSMSGDAQGTEGVFTMTGGRLAYTPAEGPLFYVTNSTGLITLKGVDVTTGSGLLLKAAAGNWGASGANGGTAILTCDGQSLTGDLAADSISTVAVTLQNGSSLTGAITNGSLALDAASSWTVTGDSVLTSLTDSSGIDGTAITNIHGGGFTVTYDAGLSANSYLAGKTYSLAGGGTLQPAAGSVATEAPVITTAGVVNAASGAAGIASGAWLRIRGGHLSTAAVADVSLPATLAGTSVFVGGESAPIAYVSPTSLTVLAPAGLAKGETTVTVTTSGRSASASTRASPRMPGLFTASGYVTATAVHPGDAVELLATGLGTAAEDVPAAAVGGKPAAVSASSLIAPGIYKIVVTLPEDLAPGIHPVVITAGGVSSPATAKVKVVAR